MHPLGLLLLALLAVPAHALTQQLPSLQPEAAVEASVSTSHGRYLLNQPDGSQTHLQVGETPIFEVEDYDFDGYPDLAIGDADGVYSIYRYRPAQRRYEPLSLPRPLLDQLDCQNLTNLQRNSEQAALYRRCSGGLHRLYDAFRFDEQGRPWLYKTLELTQEDTANYPYLSFPLFEKTLDSLGQEVASRAVVDGDQTQTWTVPTARLYLHQQPDEASRSKAYLIQGDVCEVLARQKQWLLIRYQSRKGPLERWVSLEQAYDLHQLYATAAQSPGPTLSGGLYSTQPLFTLGLRTDRPLSLAHAEVHLLFRAEDGTQYSHRLYRIAHLLELEADSSRLLDDNYVQQRDGQWVIDNPHDEHQSYVPFFPADLPPGRYRLRVALTDPSLPSPLFSEEEDTIDFPPSAVQRP